MARSEEACACLGPFGNVRELAVMVDWEDSRVLLRLISGLEKLEKLNMYSPHEESRYANLDSQVDLPPGLKHLSWMGDMPENDAGHLESLEIDTRGTSEDLFDRLVAQAHLVSALKLLGLPITEVSRAEPLFRSLAFAPSKIDISFPFPEEAIVVSPPPSFRSIKNLEVPEMYSGRTSLLAAIATRLPSAKKLVIGHMRADLTPDALVSAERILQRRFGTVVVVGLMSSDYPHGRVGAPEREMWTRVTEGRISFRESPLPRSDLFGA